MWTDFINETFVVNLKERPQRLHAAAIELAKFKIEFTTWVAIKNEDGKKGLRETMFQLFQYCLKKGYDRVCVFEDDVVILRAAFNELMDKCLDQLQKDFHLFYMGGNVWKQPVRKSANILQCPAIYSSHAIIYSKEAIEYILPLLEQELPYDVILVNSIQKFNKTYCAFPLLISQVSGYSDIAKKEVKYDKYIEKRYAEKTKDI